MDTLKKILSGFKNKKIVVVGDIILDKYLEGDVLRISPEAPVPVIKIEKEFYRIGGAGNVALNIASLGGSACLFSFAGKDAESQILKELLKEGRVENYLDVSATTIQKVRLIGRSQQLLRFDKEDDKGKIFSEEVKKIMLEKIDEADIILISDYAKGTITEDIMKFLESYKTKIIVDPKPQNKLFYKGVFLITPNEMESLQMSSCLNVQDAGRFLKKEFNSNILITRGEKGSFLFSDSEAEIPTCVKEVYDVTGAGDTVVATISLAVASNAPLDKAALIANYAAGIAVEKKGTYAVGFEELYDKVLSEEEK
ncbi:MAG: PfkB family carbohydrate kinase [Candidatus Woesearchaeota archaeon]